jgi:hypothetical protein
MVIAHIDTLTLRRGCTEMSVPGDTVTLATQHHDGGAMSENPDQALRTARDTYRYLRGGMVAVIVMLFAAVLIDSVPTWCWQESISAYYYTAARNVFVAALCCLGIMLIVYKGSADTEDVLLNLAGTLAFFVAFVPTDPPGSSNDKQIVPTNEEQIAAVDNNIGAVVVALAVAAALITFVYFADKSSRSETTPWGNWLRINSAIVLAGFVAVFLLAPDVFRAGAHYVAAILIFAIIVGVVFFNAYLVTKQDEPDRPTRERYQRRYRSIGAMMLGSLLIAIVLWAVRYFFEIEGKLWNFPLFALETALLLEFAAYWAFQTVELWNHADRKSLIDPQVQCELSFC